MIFKVIYAKKKRICQNILIFPVFADLITYYMSFVHTVIAFVISYIFCGTGEMM